MRLRLLALVVALLFARPVFANVIYDVSIDFADAAHTATYSFTMEFAIPVTPPFIKTNGQLVNPAGDFSNEKLVLDGVPMVLTNDDPNPFMWFDAVTPFPLLSPGDGFGFGTNVVCVVGGSGSGGAPVTLVCDVDGVEAAIFIRSELSNALVVERAAVPLGPTAALLVIGLAGLRLSRSWNWRQRSK